MIRFRNAVATLTLIDATVTFRVPKLRHFKLIYCLNFK